MDIDDILASVDRPDPSAPESAALDHQLLTRYWVAERGVSELLPWPAPLMERMMERVRTQIEKIEDLAAASSDPTASSSTDNTSAALPTNNINVNLTLCILQTDLSRTQFLLRSFLRQRLSKLTTHSMFYLLHIASNNHISSSAPSTSSPSDPQKQHQQPEDTIPSFPENVDPSPLSPEELQYLRAHQTLLASHFGASFLSSFPGNLRRLDDNAGGTSMVQGPENREVVFVRCLAEEVRVVVPPGDGVEEETLGTTMRMGDVWVVRWEGVKRAWEKGEVEVL